MNNVYKLSIYTFILVTKKSILIKNNLGIYAILYINKEINNQNEFEYICNDYFHNYLVKKF